MIMNKAQKTVVIYARVSTDKQAVDMQLAELQDYLKKREWRIYQEYIDQSDTGGNTKRPAFKSPTNIDT